jgi:1-acyl-sn-glycerol-3-phosphate acyltransferase
MNLLYFLAWWTLRLIFSTFFRWRVFNRENVPMHGPLIVAANHASYIDPPLVGGASPREFHFLARESLFRFYLGGAFLRGLNCVPVDREGGGGAGLKAIHDRLRKGNAIILFPEGTRSQDGQLQPAKAGIGLAVIKSGATVLPARVFGTYEAWGRHQKFPRPHRVIVKFGQPMQFDALRAEAQTCSKTRLKELYQQVSDDIMAAIAKLAPCDEKQSFP